MVQYRTNKGVRRMNHIRAFNETVAQLIVTQVASEELPVFTDLAELYFADPIPPDLSLTPHYDPLSIGLGELLVAVTPAATAVVVYVITSFSKQSSVPSSVWQEQQDEWQQSFSYEAGFQQLF